jgi:hypothetical protein
VKIFIATPMYGGIAKNNYTISMQNLIVKLSSKGHFISTTTIGNESLITRARNTLAHSFLKTDYDALLFIDSDHGWDADDVVRMVESEKDLIGAIYPMKGINWDNVRLAALAGKQNLEEYSGLFAVNLADNSKIHLESMDKPIKVKDIGTGMMFITRKVFTDLAPVCNYYIGNSVGNYFGEKIIEYFTTFIDEDRVLLSEDYAFCRMWQNIGGEVWAAPWVKITHSGDYNFSGKFSATAEIVAMRKVIENNKINTEKINKN